MYGEVAPEARPTRSQFREEPPPTQKTAPVVRGPVGFGSLCQESQLARDARVNRVSQFSKLKAESPMVTIAISLFYRYDGETSTVDEQNIEQNQLKWSTGPQQLSASNYRVLTLMTRISGNC